MRILRLQTIASRFKFSPSIHVCLRLLLLGLLLQSLQLGARSQTSERPVTLAVLDFGDSASGQLTSQRLMTNLKQETGLMVLDRDQARAAARGSGYAGSLNLSLNEARNLGAVLGC